MRDGNQEGQCCAFEMPGRSSPVKELKEEYLPEDQQKPWKSLSFTLKSFPLGKVAYKLHKTASWQPYEIFSGTDSWLESKGGRLSGHCPLLALVGGQTLGEWRLKMVGGIKPHAVANFIQNVRQFILGGLRRVTLYNVYSHKDKLHTAKTCFSRGRQITAAEVNSLLSVTPGGAREHTKNRSVL